MRKRVKRIFPVMLSIAACAEACDLPLIHIQTAVRSGALVGRAGPNHRIRVTVADLHSWWHQNHSRVTNRKGVSHG